MIKYIIPYRNIISLNNDLKAYIYKSSNSDLKPYIKYEVTLSLLNLWVYIFVFCSCTPTMEIMKMLMDTKDVQASSNMHVICKLCMLVLCKFDHELKCVDMLYANWYIWSMDLCIVLSLFYANVSVSIVMWKYIVHAMSLRCMIWYSVISLYAIPYANVIVSIFSIM